LSSHAEAVRTYLAAFFTGIVVSNIEASLPFYRDPLRLQVWWDQIEEKSKAVTGVPASRIHTVKMKVQTAVQSSCSRT
jgi:hypothetical protein